MNSLLVCSWSVCWTILNVLCCFIFCIVLHFYRVLMLMYTVTVQYIVRNFSTYVQCSAVVIKKKALKLYSMHMSVDIFNNIFIYINIIMYMQVTMISILYSLECIMPNKPSDCSLILARGSKNCYVCDSM